jgi:hypothetical protein
MVSRELFFKKINDCKERAILHVLVKKPGGGIVNMKVT